MKVPLPPAKYPVLGNDPDCVVDGDGDGVGGAAKGRLSSLPLVLHLHGQHLNLQMMAMLPLFQMNKLT